MNFLINFFNIETLSQNFTLIPELFFYFAIYSFLGWILENIHSLILTGNFFKEGFLKGPFKPMYGVTATFLISYYHKYHYLLVLIIISLIIPAAVEYSTGILLKKFFNKQYWDYSNFKLQLNSFICVRFCAYWMLLSMVSIIFIQPFINYIYNFFSPLWHFIALPCLIYIFLDICINVHIYKEKNEL